MRNQIENLIEPFYWITTGMGLYSIFTFYPYKIPSIEFNIFILIASINFTLLVYEVKNGNN